MGIVGVAWISVHNGEKITVWGRIKIEGYFVGDWEIKRWKIKWREKLGMHTLEYIVKISMKIFG